MARVPSAAAAHIGSLIAARRLELSLSQDALGVASGIDSSNIRAYENGRAMPSIHSLLRIADALGTGPGELLSGLTLDKFTARTEDLRRRA